MPDLEIKGNPREIRQLCGVVDHIKYANATNQTGQVTLAIRINEVWLAHGIYCSVCPISMGQVPGASCPGFKPQSE